MHACRQPFGHSGDRAQRSRTSAAACVEYSTARTITYLSLPARTHTRTWLSSAPGPSTHCVVLCCAALCQPHTQTDAPFPTITASRARARWSRSLQRFAVSARTTRRPATPDSISSRRHQSSEIRSSGKGSARACVYSPVRAKAAVFLRLPYALRGKGWSPAGLRLAMRSLLRVTAEG